MGRNMELSTSGRWTGTKSPIVWFTEPRWRLRIFGEVKGLAQEVHGVKFEGGIGVGRE